MLRVEKLAKTECEAPVTAKFFVILQFVSQ